MKYLKSAGLMLLNDYGGDIRRLNGGIKTEKERHGNEPDAFGVFNPPLTCPNDKTNGSAGCQDLVSHDESKQCHASVQAVTHLQK
jgi:hypothetical protein